MKTKLFPYISIALIASFLIAPAAQGFGPFWITLPELDTPATDDVILIQVVPDEPAVWQDLEHQFIMQGSRDGTIVYEDLHLMCEDPDDATVIHVTTDHHYNLEFNDEFDLFIENLDPDYHGTETIGLSCNGVSNSFMLTVLEDNVIVDEPAHWEPLQHKIITQGSPDGTVVYKELALKCYDPDDYELVSIESQHEDYVLSWKGYDLIISDLDPDYIGAEAVLLDCNGEPAKFELSVLEEQAITPIEEEEDDRLFIGSVHYPTDMVVAGDIVPITVSMKNKGGSKLEDIQVAAVIQELATRATARLDLSMNRNDKETLTLEIPRDAEPGLYNIRLTFHNGDVSRVVYREIFIV